MKTGRKAKYFCDETFFECIDSPDKAYFLGFIMADGYINKTGLTLGLSIKDYTILERFCQSLNCNIPIRICLKRNACILDIVRVKIAKDLNNLGLTNNKSQNNLTWIEIKEELMPDLIRGFFDGDGSIWNKEKSCWAMSFTGGFSFLSILKEYLNKFDIVSNPLRPRYDKKNLNSYQLDITHSDNIQRFYDTFYYDNCICLERKKEKFILFMEQFKERRKNLFSYNGNQSKILELYKNNIKQKTISEILNINYGSVRSLIQRCRKNGLC